jgi:DNA-binding GntR family transcriptional regulator
MIRDKPYRKKSHTAERVAAVIRHSIRHSELLPGEHVRQEVWAERVGVSNAATREALKMLVSERLLSYDAHRGYFVSRIDDNEMLQIYQLRRLLETATLEGINWPTEDELSNISELMDNTIEFVKKGDMHGALDAAREVSFAIFDLSPQELIVSETKRYWDMGMVYRALALGTVNDPEARDLSEYYGRILKYLKRHDRKGLVSLNLKERSNIPMRLLGK